MCCFSLRFVSPGLRFLRVVRSRLCSSCSYLLARPELGLLAVQLPGLSLWAVLLALVGQLVLRCCNCESPQTTAGAGVNTGLGSLALAGAFVLRFGGLTYPQFLTSDLVFQVHKMWSVFDGTLVFTSELPNGTLVPYPPALYVVLWPFSLLFGRSVEALSLVMKSSMALLDAATCLGLAWAGWRIWGGRVGGIAALVYAVSLAPFELFSAGNYTNLFAPGRVQSYDTGLPGIPQRA